MPSESAQLKQLRARVLELEGLLVTGRDKESPHKGRIEDVEAVKAMSSCLDEVQKKKWEECIKALKNRESKNERSLVK
jgi:hypothetical protein